MADQNVVISEWPRTPAHLAHDFNPERPLPVSFSNAANVVLSSSENPVRAELNMNLSAGKDVPVSFRLADPIIVRSEYTISIDIFDRPVATIKVAGQTILANSRDEQ